MAANEVVLLNKPGQEIVAVTSHQAWWVTNVGKNLTPDDYQRTLRQFANSNGYRRETSKERHRYEEKAWMLTRADASPLRVNARPKFTFAPSWVDGHVTSIDTVIIEDPHNLDSLTFWQTSIAYPRSDEYQYSQLALDYLDKNERNPFFNAFLRYLLAENPFVLEPDIYKPDWNYRVLRDPAKPIKGKV